LSSTIKQRRATQRSIAPGRRGHIAASRNPAMALSAKLRRSGHNARVSASLAL
jgi:hypothetical protein